ncbi:MAG: aminoglycoside phosphotransferase family protein [Acidobacteriota bacterium]
MTALPTRFAVAYVVADREAPGTAEAIETLEGQGQPLQVISLRHEPRFSWRIVFTAAMSLIREPLRTLRHPEPRVLALVQTLRDRGIGHVHAASEDVGPTAAAIASLLRARFTAGELAPVATTSLPMLDLDWEPLDARALGVRWLSTRLDNAVAEVTVRHGTGLRDVIVKRSFAAERARHECRTLALLEPVGVPRVLQTDGSGATIVMERAPGISLDRMFAAGDLPTLTAALRSAGNWLARMQAHTRSPADGATLLTSVVATAIRDANVFGRRKRRRIVSRLRELEQVVALSPLVVTGHHGDYWPGNLFIDGERVTVIDFEGFREGLPLEDVAYFLLRLELLALRFRVDMRDLPAAFLAGYGPVDRNALQLFTMTKGLRTLANRTGANLPLPQRLWTRHIVRRAVWSAIR